MDRPVIALTMGDPSGNGPELSLKALCGGRYDGRADVIVIGDLSVMLNARRILHLEDGLELRGISTPGEAKFAKGVVNVLDLGVFDDMCARPSSLRWRRKSTRQ